jgi:hypothetical protein
MDGLLPLITGFGLAAGAGGRASLVALLLGVCHYTPYFELAPSFEWLASIPVLFILGVIGLTEMWVDAHPDLKEFAHYPTYLSAFMVGFIALAASTGDVDSNILSLAGSGILGGFTGTAARYARNEVTEFIDNTTGALGDVLGDGTLNTKRSMMENVATVSLVGATIILPILGIIAVVLLLVGGIAWARSSRKDPILPSDS